jgi:AcrR family transcriptional regulator
VPRPAKFNEQQILNAAARIVASEGAPAATIGAIAQALGAPSGSIYHRFRSRDELLGRLWLSKIAEFQAGALAALRQEDPEAAAVATALFALKWVRSDPAGARIALLLRREEFEGDGWPPGMAAEARRLGSELETGLTEITRRLFGEATPHQRRAVRFAIVDIAYAALRPHLVRGEPPPAELDGLVRAAATASLRAARPASSPERGKAKRA